VPPLGPYESAAARFWADFAGEPAAGDHWSPFALLDDAQSMRSAETQRRASSGSCGGSCGAVASAAGLLPLHPPPPPPRSPAMTSLAPNAQMQHQEWQLESQLQLQPPPTHTLPIQEVAVLVEMEGSKEPRQPSASSSCTLRVSRSSLAAFTWASLLCRWKKSMLRGAVLKLLVLRAWPRRSRRAAGKAVTMVVHQPTCGPGPTTPGGRGRPHLFGSASSVRSIAQKGGFSSSSSAAGCTPQVVGRSVRAPGLGGDGRAVPAVGAV